MTRAVPLVLLLVACAPPQHAVEFPLRATVAGTPLPRLINGSAVTLSRALLGVGPIYWCSTASAGADLCGQPLLEFASTATVDLLDPRPQVLGGVRGYSGVVRSAQYDHAQSWTVTSSRPEAMPGAPDGHALVLQGNVVGAARDFSFQVDVDVQAIRQGELAVTYARTDATIGTATTGVTLDIPLARWLDGMDWAALEAAAEATGTVHIGVDHPVSQGLVLALTSNARPTFVWEHEP